MGFLASLHALNAFSTWLCRGHKTLSQDFCLPVSGRAEAPDVLVGLTKTGVFVFLVAQDGGLPIKSVYSSSTVRQHFTGLWRALRGMHDFALGFVCGVELYICHRRARRRACSTEEQDTNGLEGVRKHTARWAIMTHP